MPRLTIKNVRLAFENIFTMSSVGASDPAYSAKFIIPPDHPQVDEIRAAVKAAAKEKWEGKADTVLAMLAKDGKVAFAETDYLNKNGDPYDGFAGNFYLSTRNGGKTPTKPSAFASNNTPIGPGEGIYGGCYVDASVDIYPQDSTEYGRRINCSLRGVRFAAPGESFGGGAPASADEFGEPVETNVDFA